MSTLHCSVTSAGCVSLSVKFRLCVLVYQCVHSMALPYLADDLYLTSADGNRRHLQSLDSGVYTYQTLSDLVFMWQLHGLGTFSNQPSGMRHHFCLS